MKTLNNITDIIYLAGLGVGILILAPFILLGGFLISHGTKNNFTSYKENYYEN